MVPNGVGFCCLVVVWLGQGVWVECCSEGDDEGVQAMEFGRLGV